MKFLDVTENDLRQTEYLLKLIQRAKIEYAVTEASAMAMCMDWLREHIVGMAKSFQEAHKKPAVGQPSGLLPKNIVDPKQPKKMGKK